MCDRVRAIASVKPGLVANETLYQLSYDPILLNCKLLSPLTRNFRSFTRRSAVQRS